MGNKRGLRMLHSDISRMLTLRMRCSVRNRSSKANR